MIQKQFIRNANTKRWFWVLMAVTSLLIGLGIGQSVQFREVTAQAQDEPLSQFAAELDAMKAEYDMLQGKWQSELLEQLVPTLADEPEAVKRQFVDFLEEIGTSGTDALVAMLQDSSKRVRKMAVEALGGIGEDERKAGRNYDTAASGIAMALKDDSEDVFREAVAELGDVRPISRGIACCRRAGTHRRTDERVIEYTGRCPRCFRADRRGSGKKWTVHRHNSRCFNCWSK